MLNRSKQPVYCLVVFGLVTLSCSDDASSPDVSSQVGGMAGAVASGGSAPSGGTAGVSSGAGGNPANGGTGTGGAGVGGSGPGGSGTGGSGTGGSDIGEPTCVSGIQTGSQCNPRADTEACVRSDRTCLCGADSTWTCTPNSGTGGSGAGGSGTGGTGTGGAEAGGTGEGGSGEAGTPGVGGAPPGSTGPCDIYAEADTPCVAAYSMVRRILSTYSGPLYQVRSGSSAQNTGSGGEVHDIPMTTDGFADKAAHDAACSGSTCTVSLLYDQSGNENNLPVGKGGRTDGGQWADDDDFESIADAGPLTVGGHQVYSLYMDQRQGYRTPLNVTGNNMPLHEEPQGIYMLADGTHYGTACCWDFGNVSPDPKKYGVMNTLFFGTAFWGEGAGNGPWFMADYEAGVWAGGSVRGDPGWGALNEKSDPNMNNPSLGVPFALGFLKTDPQDWALRMADVQTATSITEAYRGRLPKGMNNEGGIVLGVGGDNSNNSWGTFFEGAITQGWPTDEAEQAVMENIQAAGYGQ